MCILPVKILGTKSGFAQLTDKYKVGCASCPSKISGNKSGVPQLTDKYINIKWDGHPARQKYQELNPVLLNSEINISGMGILPVKISGSRQKYQELNPVLLN